MQNHAIPTKWTSTGIATLDAVLGEGLPHGAIGELSGDREASRTLGLYLIGNAQRKDQIAAYIDGRAGFTPAMAARAGIDMATLLVSQPDSIDVGLEIVDTLARSTAVDLIIIDYDLRVPHDEDRGLRSRYASMTMRKLCGALFKTKCAVLFITGDSRPTPAHMTYFNNALKFYSSLRCQVRTVEGGLMLNTTKNKFAPPFDSAEIALAQEVK